MLHFFKNPLAGRGCITFIRCNCRYYRVSLFSMEYVCVCVTIPMKSNNPTIALKKKKIMQLAL